MESSSSDSRTIDGVINDLGFGRFQLAVVVLCGALQASVMMEIQYVSMVSQKLQCVWRISDFSKSLVASVTYMGLLVGAYLWGSLGDKFCRRSVTAVCTAFVAFYGFLTALAPNIAWVVSLCFLVGAGVGGVQSLPGVMLTEFMPAQRRGLAWFLFQSFWSVGGLAEIALAWLILDLEEGWRYLAGLTALPMLLLLLVWLLWMPPSPRQSLLQGRIAETRCTLDRMADANSRPRFVGNFEARDCQQREHEQGSFLELLRPDTFLRQTLLLAIINCGCGFGYYGIILLNVQVPLQLKAACPTYNSTAGPTADWLGAVRNVCHRCDNLNYMELLVPTLADLANTLLNALIIERLLGRRVTMAVSLSLSALLIPLLSLCMPSAAQVVLFFIVRLLISCGYSVVMLYAIEAYPTTLRSTAIGFTTSFGQITSIISPFVAQVFVSHVSLLGGLLIFSGLLCAAAVSAALLPWETKDRPLAQSEVAAGFPSEENSTLQTGAVGKGNDPPGAIYGSLAAKRD